MAVSVRATGVLLSVATPAEVMAVRRLRLGAPIEFPHGFMYDGGPVPQRGQADVTAQGFVEFVAAGQEQRWVSNRHYGSVVTLRDPAQELLAIAVRVWEDDALDPLSDMHIAGIASRGGSSCLRHTVSRSTRSATS